MCYKASTFKIRGSALSVHGVEDAGTASIVLTDPNWSRADAERVASALNGTGCTPRPALVALLREGAVAERARLRPLLKVCFGLVQELEPAASFSDPRPDVQRALADLRAELGEEGGDA